MFQFADWSVALNLRAVDIASKFEVFVVRVSRLQPVDDVFGRDELILSDFRIAEIDLIRRGEWIEGTETEPKVEASVDAGLVLRGSNGVEIEFCADAFPLAFQLRFVAGGSGRNERINQHFVPIARP